MTVPHDLPAHNCGFCAIEKVHLVINTHFAWLPTGCSSVVVEYRTHNREVVGSTHTRSTASNLEQVANLLHAQANSASYPQRDGK